MTEIITLINEYWLFITIGVIVLTWLADLTGWKWLDKVVDLIKEVLNLITGGKKLYTVDDVKKHESLDALEKDEKEYRKKTPIGRIAELPKKLIKKK